MHQWYHFGHFGSVDHFGKAPVLSETVMAVMRRWLAARLVHAIEPFEYVHSLYSGYSVHCVRIQQIQPC